MESSGRLSGSGPDFYQPGLRFALVRTSSEVRPSVVTFLHWWIKGLQFDAGVVGREAPLHGDSQLIALFRPGRDLRPQRLRVGDAQGQGLAFEGIDLDLRDVEPAGMLGGVHPLQAAGDAPGRGGLKTRVQDGGFVRVEIVADHRDALRLGKVYVHQVLQDLGASQLGAARRHLHVPPAHKRRRDHEQVGRAHAPVLVILAGRLPGSRGQRRAHFLMEDLGDFVRPHTPPDVGGPGGAGRYPGPLPYGRQNHCPAPSSDTRCGLSQAAAGFF